MPLQMTARNALVCSVFHLHTKNAFAPLIRFFAPLIRFFAPLIRLYRKYESMKV